MISIIATIGKNNEIGTKAKKLWNLPISIKLFEKLTKNNSILMGYNTYEEYKSKGFQTEINYVLTNGFLDDGYNRANTNEIIKDFADDSDNNILIIGGEATYKKFIDKAHCIYLTEVDESIDADKHFPEFDKSLYEEYILEETVENNLSCKNILYRKKETKRINEEKMKLIVVEGPQGCGKTTVTDYIRNSMKSVNLYRLSGSSDASINGKQKVIDMYDDLFDYIKKLEYKSINLLFDRSFFSEENYCRLGKKQYKFTEEYEKFLKIFSELNFDIYYINIYLKDRLQYQERLLREDKANVSYSAFSSENSVQQEKVYKEILNEINEKYPNIKTLDLNNSKNIFETEKQIKKFIDFK